MSWTRERRKRPQGGTKGRRPGCAPLPRLNQRVFVHLDRKCTEGTFRPFACRRLVVDLDGCLEHRYSTPHISLSGSDPVTAFFGMAAGLHLGEEDQLFKCAWAHRHFLLQASAFKLSRPPKRTEGDEAEQPSFSQMWRSRVFWNSAPRETFRKNSGGAPRNKLRIKPTS